MSNWFAQLFGFDEEEYDKTRERLTYDSVTRTIKSDVEGCPAYHVGRFETPTLAQLKADLDPRRSEVVGKCTLEIVSGDVSEMMANPENRYAVFQAASQFNCLEFTGPNVVPEEGITQYILDRTQGPACSIGCGPATAFRNYWVPVTTPEGETQFGQTSRVQLNMLEDVSRFLGNTDNKFYAVIGGYSMASDEQLVALNHAIDERGDFGDHLRVGIHYDVQVTSRNWGRDEVNLNPPHLITQVFGSACAVQYNRSRSKNWEKFASGVLRASYMATFYAALRNRLDHLKDPENENEKNGSKKLFLTQLGGGVFGNDIEWIVLAILDALNAFKNVDLEVKLVTYGRVPHELSSLRDWQDEVRFDVELEAKQKHNDQDMLPQTEEDVNRQVCSVSDEMEVEE